VIFVRELPFLFTTNSSSWALVVAATKSLGRTVSSKLLAANVFFVKVASKDKPVQPAIDLPVSSVLNVKMKAF
jgi:hypothetical protein